MDTGSRGSGPSRKDRPQRRANSPSSNVSSSPSRNPRQRPRQQQRQQESPPEPVERRRSARRLFFSDESTAPGEEDPEEESDVDDDSQVERERRRTPARERDRRRTPPDTRGPPAPQPRQRQRQKSGDSSTGTLDNNNDAAFSRPGPRSQSRGGGGGRPSSSDTIDLPRQIDRLQRDLARRDQELADERTENERALNRIRKLERDKTELEQELEEVRDELNEYVIKYDELRNAAGTPSSSGKKRLQFQDQTIGGSSDEQQNVNEIVENKNREIATLLEDVEKLEQEKHALHQKLADLRDSLQEATTQIESMTQESAELKSMLEKTDMKITKLEEEKTILEIKERDLLTFKERHEKYLENLCSAVDVRVDVWKRMMMEKDEEIDRLNIKIGALLAQIPNTQIDNEKSAIRQLKKRILDREEQINLLNQQLHQATVDIETHTKTIQDLQYKLNYSENNDQTQKFVHSLEARLKKYSAALQQKSQVVHTYEKEIEERSREVTQLRSRLHDYETGQYGLVDAIAEIKSLKGQQRVRDKQIEELTQDVNQLQLQRQDVLDENELLRSKLGLADQKSLRQETDEFVHSRSTEIERAKGRIRVLENEVVELKSKNYSLRKELIAMTKGRHQRTASLPSSPSPPPQDRRKAKESTSTRPRSGSGRESRRSDYTMTTPTIMGPAHDLLGVDLSAPEWKEKYEIILNENTELRKGMVEILESMRRLSEESTSNILIESPILENLLREMSARGLINYPYSVSGFHLKVCNLEGKNSELREEIHRLRSEEKQLRIELIEAKVQLQKARDQLKELEIDYKVRPYSPYSHSKSQDAGSAWAKSPRAGMRPPSSALAETGEQSQIRSDSISVSGLDLAQSPQTVVHAELQSEIQRLLDENNNLKSTHAEEKSHLESQLESLVQKGNEIIQLSASGRPGDAILERKFQFLQFLNQVVKAENHKLLTRTAELENATNSKVSYLERFRMRALDQIGQYQSMLEASIPLSTLYTTRKQLESLRREWDDLQTKNDELTLRCMHLEKSALEVTELKRLNDKYKKEVEQSKSVINAMTLAASGDSREDEGTDGQAFKAQVLQLRVQNEELNQTLQTVQRELEELTRSNAQLEQSKDELTVRSNELSSTVRQLEQNERQLKFNLGTSVRQEEYEELQSQLRSTQQQLTTTKDELVKWKDLVEMGQNQILAMENIKNFEKMEVESLVSQVCDLQAEELDKVELARVKREMVSCEKERLLAVQQLEKLQARLSHYEVLHFQQEKQHSDREMSILAMHTQVISRYRNLFTALYDNQTSNIGGPQSITKSLVSSEQVHEAWDLFIKCKAHCDTLEAELVQTQEAADVFKEKCSSLEEMLTMMRDNAENNNSGSASSLDALTRLQDTKLEVARWKRKAEQGERKIATLQDTVDRLESKTNALEEARIRYEHSLDLKDSLAQLMSMPSVQPTRTSRPATGPAAIETSPSTIQLRQGRSISQLVQTEENLSDVYEAHVQINQLKTQVSQLETLLNAKDQVLNEFKVLRVEPYKQPSLTAPASVASMTAAVASPRGSNPELVDALQVAQDSIVNLQERLKVKEDNIASYRKLLAEMRNELATSSERHVQEMKALQDTIYQQQQAYARMKSTLSHPVRDTVNIEGALRDQLTRINELEDEVSELQHTLGNVASQLTSARSEANRWKSLADAKTKELDSAKEHLSEETLEELKLLREKLRTQEELLREFRIGPSSEGPGTGTKSVRFSNEEIRRESELVQMLRAELTEKERRLNTYSNAIQGFKKGGPKSSERRLPEDAKEKEIHELKEKNCQLQQKITALTLKVSRINAINQSSGVTAELEDLRSRFKTLQEERFNLQKRFDELQMKGHDDEEKRRKQIDSLARWDESKRWKKIVEKFEARIQELETENEKAIKTNQTLRLIVARLEKEKHLVDSKLLHHTRNVSRLSKSRDSVLIGEESTTDVTGTDAEQQRQSEVIVADAAATIDRLKLESHELKEALQKTEMESKQTEEKLRMEIRVLKERITSQERQITAYQVASKGDPKIIAEIEKMVHNEESLQKQLLKLEEENLHVNLQMEQLKMDTPRLRDRVQHLQKLVEVLKVEKPVAAGSSRTNFSSSSLLKPSTNQKSLSELERTIAALKNVIDKLQTENKKLKRPTTLSLRKSGSAGAGSTEKLKASIAGLLDEKQLLMDQLHELEHEKQKYHQMYLDVTSTVDHLQISLMDTEKKAKSAEMRLKSFLDQRSEVGAEGASAAGLAGPSGNEKMFQYMREMQDKLDRKEQLLVEAKEALKEAAEANKAQRQF